METFLSILIGLGLSAACGFRVFIPFVVAGLAVRTGHLKFAEGFAWMGTDAALIAFGVAAAVEVAAYYIPWLDHALDLVATPAAMVAGAILSASMVTDLGPFLRWTLPLIAGGMAAGTVQGATVAGRTLSTATTGGVGNPMVATMEWGGALAVSVLAIAMPVGLCLALIAGSAYAWKLWQSSKRARVA
jgi:hypothetical protein